MELPKLEGSWWRLRSRTPVVFAGSSPVKLHPGAIFNDALFHMPSPIAFIGVDIPTAILEVRKLVINRPGELGDVLVALAACRLLRKHFTHLETVTLRTGRRFMELCKCQSEVNIATSTNNRHFNEHTMCVDFTGYFELDHKPGAVHISRLDRVMLTFGVS